MHSSERVHEAIRVGCLQQIIHLLQDTDETVRYKAVSVLFSIVQHTVGRENFIKLGGLEHLVKLFDDQSIKIKLVSFQAVNELASLSNYAAYCVEADLINVIVDKHLSNVDANIAEGSEILQVVLNALCILQKLLYIKGNLIKIAVWGSSIGDEINPYSRTPRGSFPLSSTLTTTMVSTV